jgi:hypothetical protein
MKIRKSITTNRLAVCLTACLSIATLTGSADATLTVSPYGVEIPLPEGMEYRTFSPFEAYGTLWGVARVGTSPIRFLEAAGQIAYTRGSDLTFATAADVGWTFLKDSTLPFLTNGWLEGAEAGNANFANLDLNGDNKFETVAQFHFDEGGGGYMMALAQDNSGDPLSISVGKGFIEQGPGTYTLNAVPEPASVLGTMGLLASGLLLRRRGRTSL